jgi:predicted CoA-binding protein
MKQNIVEFINGKRIAVIGVSRSGKKFGNAACTEMAKHGYEMVIIHPEASEIEGKPCYATLSAVPGKLDGVLISVRSKQAVDAAMRDAVAAGIRNIWVQKGAESPELAQVARELGVDPVIGKCVLMYAKPVTGMHAFHRGFARIFGGL